ncbi:MAG: sulfatase-like hydrolase/transferase [Rhizobiales bacterium]|nr:sulfatase-like hydrolase/transferase [Hyphomicrobiales bacterium]
MAEGPKIVILNDIFRSLSQRSYLKIVLSVTLLLGGGAAAPAASSATPEQKPNIVIILIDDAALMDLGIYGGEAHTPNIDALARRGVLFTHYRTSPMCAPSRAMLLTGMDSHRTGVGTIREVIPPELKGQPGYTLHLEPGVFTIADRLRADGYETYMAGKWHLGSGAGDLPVDHGFDRSFALDASGADNWEDKPFNPLNAEAPWYEDDKSADYPDGTYSSTYLVDKLIEYLDSSRDHEAPFFAYLPFLAIHIPVQAPAAYTAKYRATYQDGWDNLQTQRWSRAKSRGLVGEGAAKPRMHPALRDWQTQDQKHKELFAARMAVNAGMLEAMDHEVGRFIDHIKEMGRYDNTIFVVTSDNGPEGTDVDDPRIGWWMALHGYQRGIAHIGERGSFAFIGPEYASGAAAPSYLFKLYMSEGGVRAPLVMAGPGIPSGGQALAGKAFVADLTPTLLDIVKPDDPLASSLPMDGRSLMPMVLGQKTEVYTADEAVAMEAAGSAALYKGNYKIVRNLGRLGNRTWELYDLAKDPAEAEDLSVAMKPVFDDLLADYQAYAKRVGVIDLPADYDPMAQADSNVMSAILHQYGGWFLLILASLGAMIGLAVYTALRLIGKWRRTS